MENSSWQGDPMVSPNREAISRLWNELGLKYDMLDLDSLGDKRLPKSSVNRMLKGKGNVHLSNIQIMLYHLKEHAKDSEEIQRLSEEDLIVIERSPRYRRKSASITIEKTIEVITLDNALELARTVIIHGIRGNLHNIKPEIRDYMKGEGKEKVDWLSQINEFCAEKCEPRETLEKPEQFFSSFGEAPLYITSSEFDGFINANNNQEISIRAFISLALYFGVLPSELCAESAASEAWKYHEKKLIIDIYV